MHCRGDGKLLCCSGEIDNRDGKMHTATPGIRNGKNETSLLESEVAKGSWFEIGSREGFFVRDCDWPQGVKGLLNGPLKALSMGQRIWKTGNGK
ncbi:hypothetical protein LXL04_000031 [Taraxacum kok-saghyz]